MKKMKQKIVLQVHMPCEKCKQKAKEIVASDTGMLSMSIDTEKSQLVIVGEGMDAVMMATSLRNKVGRTTIISVEQVKSEDKKKEEEAAKKKKEEEAKKKKEEEERNKCNCCGHCNCYALPPPPPPSYHICYCAPSYPNTWFSW